MGMYTEIMFAAEVDREAYRAIRGAREGAPSHGHPFWEKPRWRAVFGGSSYYFPGANHFQLEVDVVRPEDPMYFVSFRSNLKNYDDEVEAFFDWVLPHVKGHYGRERCPVGWHRYEETDEPTIVYKEID